jgi:hypothetical protein
MKRNDSLTEADGNLSTIEILEEEKHTEAIRIPIM